VNDDTIQLEDLYGKPLWPRLLYRTLGGVLTVPGACVLWAAAQAGLFFWLSWYAGTLLPSRTPGQMSLLEDTTALSYYFLLPLIFLLHYYSLRFFRRYLNRLGEVLGPSAPADAHAFLIETARHTFRPEGMRRVRLFFVVGGLLIFLYNALTNLFPARFYGTPLKWDGIAFPVAYAASRLFALFVWVYVLPIWLSEVSRQFVALLRTSRAMAERGWLKVSPLAADRFGGLRRLAVSASFSGYLVLVAGVFFLAPLVRSVAWGLPLHLGNYVGLGLYVLFAAAGAFAPVYLMHGLLARKQEEMLDLLTEAFDRLNARVEGLVKRGEVEGLGEEGLGRALGTIDLLHRQWSSLPLWPISVGLVLNVLVTVVPPVALYFLEGFLTKFQV
jgi:hypothetical protein